MHNADLCNHDYYVLLNFSHGSHTGTPSGTPNFTNIMCIVHHPQKNYLQHWDKHSKERISSFPQEDSFLDFKYCGGGQTSQKKTSHFK